MANEPQYVVSDYLPLPRCPHCGIARPSLNRVHALTTRAHLDPPSMERLWCFFACTNCGGVVSACALRSRNSDKQSIFLDIFPSLPTVEASVPDRARTYLQQAQESIHAPAGSIMLSASAVDAMLKAKGYKDGSLYDRINKAAENHIVTQDMASWAHDVRLDANDQRHADETAALPNEDDAKRTLDFARALAEFLFVLPARVLRGRAAATKK